MSQNVLQSVSADITLHVKGRVYETQFWYKRSSGRNLGVHLQGTISGIVKTYNVSRYCFFETSRLSHDFDWHNNEKYPSLLEGLFYALVYFSSHSACARRYHLFETNNFIFYVPWNHGLAKRTSLYRNDKVMTSQAAQILYLGVSWVNNGLRESRYR